MQRQFQITWLTVFTAALGFVVYLHPAPKPAASPTLPSAPVLPGTGVSLADALEKSNKAAAGKTVGVQFEGIDSQGQARYTVQVKLTEPLYGFHYARTVPLEGAPPFPCEFETPSRVLSPERVPQDGREYIFFMSDTGNGLGKIKIFKMLPADMTVSGILPGESASAGAEASFPEKPELLREILRSLCNVVTGRFVKFERRFEIAVQRGDKVIWVQKYKAVIDVRRKLRGDVDPGLVEGDVAYEGTEDKDATNRPRPMPPDMTRDYLFFLWLGRPADHVQAGPAFPKDFIFYLAPGRPAETLYPIDQAFPADALPEPARPPAPTPAVTLPLPGSDLSLEKAKAKAETVVVGRLFGISAFYGNGPVYNQNDTVEIVKTLRGKASGATIQYVVPVKTGREAPLELGKQYLFFISHYGVPLKVAPSDAILALPLLAPGESKSSSRSR